LDLSGGLGISLLDALDVEELLVSQLHELLLGEISVVQGGKERLRGDERGDAVGGLGSSGSSLLLLFIIVLLDQGREGHELVSKMELLHEPVVWLRMRLLKLHLLLVPVGERDPHGGGHLKLIVRHDRERMELEVRTKAKHPLDRHEAGMNLWRHVCKG
jgi:hypothetical protein